MNKGIKYFKAYMMPNDKVQSANYNYFVNKIKNVELAGKVITLLENGDWYANTKDDFLSASSITDLAKTKVN